MQKYSTISTYKDVFVEQFQQHQKEATPAAADPKGASEKHENTSSEAKAPEEEDFTAQEIFNKVLTDSVLYYLFVNSTTSSAQNANSTDGSATGEGEKEKEESKLSVIFQAFLQTAAFSYQSDPNEPDATQDEDEQTAQSEAAEPEGANEELD